MNLEAKPLSKWYSAWKSVEFWSSYDSLKLVRLWI